MSARIGILGLGRSGRAAARLALARGNSVYASDSGDTEELRAAAAEVRAAGGEAAVGGHAIAVLAQCDFIVVSPGIPRGAPVLNDARLAGIPMIPELEFAFRHLDAPVIGVTGTNGKSTTTALAAHLLQTADFDAPAAGNIGLALSEVALREEPPDWVVVEASSFQLAGIDSFAPRIGVVTNLSPDHLDRYASVDDYYADKAKLFRNAVPSNVWVLNGEDAAARALPGEAAGERQYFRAESALAAREHGGYVAADGGLMLRAAEGDTRLLNVSELRIGGRHNHANALAATLAAVAAGADRAALQEGLRSFAGLEHRLEPVLESNGVLWVNDSKATNVGSTLVALRSMTRPTVLLLGGRHKGEPYTTLLSAMGPVRVVVAYGEAAERVAGDLGPHVRVERVSGRFEDVMAKAAALARPGDVVLLSPACSSYDMFRNYEERGRRFKELAARQAEVLHG